MLTEVNAQQVVHPLKKPHTNKSTNSDAAGENFPICSSCELSMLAKETSCYSCIPLVIGAFVRKNVEKYKAEKCASWRETYSDVPNKGYVVISACHTGHRGANQPQRINFRQTKLQ